MLPHDPSKISPIFSKAFMRDAYSYSEDSGPKPDSNPKQESCHQIKDVARKFKMETSLHGLKYIAESDRHILERLFWVIVVLMSWCTAGYLIYVVIVNNYTTYIFKQH